MINKCSYYKNYGCGCSTNVCSNLVVSTSVQISGSQMVVTIPQATYTNNQKLCILIAQDIPASATPLPVVIAVTGSSINIPYRTICGHNVFSDQLIKGKIYPSYAATDSQTFVCRIKERCLPCTNYDFSATIPAASTPATASATK